MDSIVTTASLVQIDVDLGKKKQDLGKAEVKLDEALIFDKNIGEAEQAVALLKQDLARLERKKEAEQRRRDKASVEEKASRQRQEELVELNIRQQIYDLVQEGDRHIATLKDWGERMTAAANAGRALADRTLTYEVAKATNGLRPHLGFALKQFQGMDTGLAPFLKLDQQRYKDLFPDPKTSTPTKKAK